MLRRIVLVLILLTCSIYCLSGSVQAQGTAEGKWYEEVAINGMASTSFEFNSNRPADHLNQYRVFDTDEGTFQLDVVELVAQKTPVGAGSAGFRFDLTAGSGIPRVAASRGLFRDASGQGQDFDLQQAMVCYVAPLGSGLRLDFGKHVTHMGYEVIDGYDGTNDQATRSLLFGYAIPFTHTGLKASYSFTPKVSATGYLVNGWDNVRDNNTAKSLGAQLSLAPASTVTLLLNYLGGAEQDSSNSNLRHMVDLVGIFKPQEKLTLGFNADYGKEANALMSADATGMESAHWQGAALYARVGVSPRFALCARGEFFDDAKGVRTGVQQKLKEVTVTPELRLAPGFLVRTDLRYDMSDQKVFHKKSGEADSKNQATISLNALFTF
jgi:hypothetical protein